METKKTLFPQSNSNLFQKVYSKVTKRCVNSVFFVIHIPHTITRDDDDHACMHVLLLKGGKRLASFFHLH